jgi:capsular polysaccharide transport system permease protein
MTTKPKAKKFRIRRSPAAEAAFDPEGQTSAQSSQMASPQSPASAGAPEAPAMSHSAPPPGDAPRTGEVSSSQQVASEADIDAIRQEGLTGRQLRMARRVAHKHGLAPTSDFDAVRLLRAKGIDPFQRTNMLELVKPEASAQTKKPQPRMQLPQTIPVDKKEQLPSTEVTNPAERRAAEIRQIQHEIARRRRKKMMLLMARLAAFVFLPAIIAGYYFFAVATPMYSTKSEFLIIKNDGAGSPTGGLFAGSPFATATDAIAVQSYLQSKDAMLRLSEDEGFKEHFSSDAIDPIQRLEENPSNEEAFKLYKRHVVIGFDPTEGVIKMEVIAADPTLAVRFSEALIGYAEERVDNLSLRKRSNAVQDAEQSLADAEQARRDAQIRMVRLQQDSNAVDPEAQIAALRSQINTYELQLQEKQLQLQALLDNARPNRAKVDGARGDIRRLETLLDDLNTRMITATTGEGSLAEKAAQIQLAQADLATRDLMLQTALQSLESARREAASQARYLTTSVEPVVSQDPAYPRSFENTILAFLIFAGAYLMVSLTASILREQVSG